MPLALQPQNSLSLHTLDNGKKTKHSNEHSFLQETVEKDGHNKEQNSINIHMHTQRPYVIDEPFLQELFLLLI